MRILGRHLAEWLKLLVLLLMPATSVDGIRIVDLRKRGDCFTRTLVGALGLVREYDPRRYKRIIRHIGWIVNEFALSRGMEYEARNRVCSVEFSEAAGIAQELLVAVYASGLIHEATHGVVISHGIPYDDQMRIRIEQLCVKEQNRFLVRLAHADPERYPLELIHVDFNESDWEPDWTMNRLQKVLRAFSRARREWKAEPHPAPNGGPATPVGNSGAPEGPGSERQRET